MTRMIAISPPRPRRGAAMVGGGPYAGGGAYAGGASGGGAYGDGVGGAWGVTGAQPCRSCSAGADGDSGALSVGGPGGAVLMSHAA